MVVNSLFRITGPRKIVDVDDVSSSPNKATNQVLLFENTVPEDELVYKFIEGTTAGTIIVFDAFDKTPFNVFDSVSGAVANLMVLKVLEVDSVKAVLCLPDDYL